MCAAHPKIIGHWRVHHTFLCSIQLNYAKYNILLLNIFPSSCKNLENFRHQLTWKLLATGGHTTYFCSIQLNYAKYNVLNIFLSSCKNLENFRHLKRSFLHFVDVYLANSTVTFVTKWYFFCIYASFLLVPNMK